MPPPPRATRRLLRTLLGVLVVLVGMGVQWLSPARDGGTDAPVAPPADTAFENESSALERAWRDRESGQFLTIEAQVTALLPDDNEGDRHQRMIVALPSGHTVLVSHNIDLAPRVEGLTRGAVLRIRGEYEWNAQGGVLHWTHHDPQGRQEGGWIDHLGKRHR